MKLPRVLILAHRIITQLYHDKRTVALVIFVPMLVLSLGAMLFRAESATISLGIVNYDTGIVIPPANKLVVGKLISDELSNSTTFKIIKLSQSEIDKSLSNGTVQGVIFFPGEFSAEFLKNRQAVLDLHLEGSNPTMSATIIARVTEAAMKALAGLVTAGIGLPGTSGTGGEAKLPITVESTYLYAGKEFDMMDYIAPVYIGLLDLFFVFLLTCVAFLRERSQGTMERLLATPVTRLEIILGYMLGLGFFALIQVTIILFFTVWVLNIHYLGNLGLLFLVVTILALVGVSQGIVASVFARNEFQVIQFIPLLIFPQVLLGGTFWPVEELPSYLQPFANVLPLTYANRALRDVMLKGWGLTEIWPNILILLTFTAIFTAIGVLTMRREIA